MKKLLTFCLLLPIFLFSFDYQQEWKAIEDLNNQRLPKSALEKVEHIYKEAKQEKNSVQIIRAVLYKKNYLKVLNENGQIEAILFVKKTINETSVVEEKALLTSILAQMYQNYFNQNRYKIQQRTAIKNNESRDITTWSSEDFLNKTYTLYQKSLEPLTQMVSIDKYKEILTEAKNVKGLRPTLYDLLVFRALNYFQNEASYLHQTKEPFFFKHSTAFSDANSFSQLIFNVKDKKSFKYQTTLLYQKLLKFHLKRNNHKALEYINLQRLNFVKRNFQGEKRDSLYVGALKQLFQENRDSEALIELMQYYYQKGDDIETLSLIQEALLSQNLFVQQRAKSIENSIKTEQLSISLEEVVLPHKNILTKVSYRNIDKLYVKVLKLTPAQKVTFVHTNYNKKMDYLLQLAVLKNLSFNLPRVDDYKEHGTEISLGKYDLGQYIFLLSANKSFTSKTFYKELSISNLALLQQDKEEILVLHRATGKPLKGVKAILYNSKNKSIETKKSNAQGKVNFSDLKNYYNVRLEYKKDILDVHNHIQRGYRYEERNYAQKSVHFFTDRSLYRPGQTLYFKGLATEQYAKKKPNILTNEEIVVSFRDTNGQTIKEQTFTTDEFGTFHGDFTAPKTGLLGRMTIASSIGGQATVRVEEYKQPKFEVNFEPIKIQYGFGDTIAIKGLVKAYAGNHIDGAKITFKVERETSFFWRPYNRLYPHPYKAAVEIATGTTTSNDKGKFIVNFVAKEDASINPKDHPSYTYLISVNVTDRTGETHVAETTYNIGHVNFNVEMLSKNELDSDDNKTIALVSSDLNGEFIPITGSIDIEKIEIDNKLYVDRYWQMGDKKMYSEEEFNKLFPLYRYNEKKEQNKALIETLYFNTAKSKEVSLQHLKEGEYLLTLRTYDNSEALTKTKKISIVNSKSKHLISPAYLWHKHKEKSYNVGETATLTIKSSLSKAQVLLTIVQYNKVLNEKWIELKSLHKELIKIKKSYQGNIQYHLNMVHDNREFKQNGQISIPWDNKLKIEYLTFRDKLKPNEKEQWRLKISGENRERVMAQMVATIYDASLDALNPHNFYDLHLYPYSSANYRYWYAKNFTASNAGNSWRALDSQLLVRQFSTIKWLNSYNRHMNYRSMAKGGYAMASLAAPSPAPVVPVEPVPVMEESYGAGGDINAVTVFDKETTVETQDASQSQTKKEKKSQVVNIRKNLKETMFFKPDLKTDEEGNIIIDFKTNDALTRWNFMAFTHTKDLKTAVTKKSFSTAKELMVVTNLPRFFREKDHITLSAKVVNMSDKDLNGTCELQLVDPSTEQPIFNREFKQSISVKKGSSTIVNFEFTVPNVEKVSAIKHTIIAKTENHSDAEQIIRPILSNRVFVTESKNMFVKAHENKSFTLESLKNANSNTLSNHKLTLEFSSNPAWYAIKSLPYLMEYPHECNEQLFNRYFANTLAAKIANSSPKIKEVFESWKSKSELISALETNTELKSVLIEETPWVLNAKSETEQQANLGILFDLVRLAKEEKATYDKLIKRQLEHNDGGWAWFESPHSNWYITQYIVEGFGKLKKLGIDKTNTEAMAVATHYIDMQMLEQYKKLLKEVEEHGVNLEDEHLSSIIIHYLYARSFYTFKMSKEIQEAHNYYLEQSKKYWVNQGLYEQGMIALTLEARQEKTSALAIVKSLRERALVSDELGMYFNYNNGFYWNEMPIETHALMIDVFNTVGNDQKAVELLKTWLLTNKQTNHWKTTKATASAIYALLSDTKWIENNKAVELSFNTTLPYEETLKNATVQDGTGYIKASYKKFDKSMATVNVKNPNDGIAWGALYWQYFENMDKVKGFQETPLTLKKKLFLIEKSPQGEVLSPITNQILHVGDKVKVRIELKVDRDMEYIMLKDARASAFEPVNVLSQYKYQDGLGYYESTKDNATYFFMDYLRKGTYVFEYPLFVTHKGDFSNGITTIESMYAPEFKSHSEGVRVLVQ